MYQYNTIKCDLISERESIPTFPVRESNATQVPSFSLYTVLQVEEIHSSSDLVGIFSCQGSNMMCGLIDLNTVDNEVETELLYNSPASSATSGNSELTIKSSETAAAVSMELWHACAGPSISLPKKGTAMVYFPQGHLEYLSENPAVAYDFPPHVFCRVVDVKLHVSFVEFLFLNYLRTFITEFRKQ